MSPTPRAPVLRFRSIFISDLHLGSRDCSAEHLLDFLRTIETDTLYLVGDIVDFWALGRSFYWPGSHQAVLDVLIEKSRNGTRVIYVPGNHDWAFKSHHGSKLGNIEVRHEDVHTLADGKRMLVIHGDQFDEAIKINPVLEALGNTVYSGILALNRCVNFLRRNCGLSYWSVAAYLKKKSKKAVDYMANFESAVIAEAQRRGFDGVICGHIHRAELKHVDGVTYCNDGDWVENCTTLAEHEDGSLILLRWTERKEVLSRYSIQLPEYPVECAA